MSASDPSGEAPDPQQEGSADTPVESSDDVLTNDGDGTASDDAASGGESITVEELISTLELVTAERDQHLDGLQRVSAEFANFRKQAEKRSIEVAAVARGALAERLLPVLDACDLAIEHGADAVVPIRSSLVNALEPAGLEVLDPVDQPFDPTLHEAVLHVPAEDGDDVQVVVEVLRRGYAWSGRVLRPAMVKVRG